MTPKWGQWCVIGLMILGVSACGKHKDIGGNSFQSDSVQSAVRDVRQKTVDVQAEIRATVKNMFGASFAEEVSVVHIPMTILNTLEFEQDPVSGLFQMRKLFHPIQDAFLVYSDLKSSQIFVDQYTPPFQVFLVTEAVPYTQDAEYYLSTTVEGLPYYYVVGVDVESATRLGIPNVNKVVASEDPDVHTIVILKKSLYGAVMDEVPVEP